MRSAADDVRMTCVCMDDVHVRMTCADDVFVRTTSVCGRRPHACADDMCGRHVRTTCGNSGKNSSAYSLPADLF